MEGGRKEGRTVQNSYFGYFKSVLNESLGQNAEFVVVPETYFMKFLF